MKYYTNLLPSRNSSFNAKKITYFNKLTYLRIISLLLICCCVRSSIANCDIYHPTEDNPLNIYSDNTDLTNAEFLIEAKKSFSNISENLENASESWLKPSATFLPISISGVADICLEDGVLQITGNPTSSLGSFTSDAAAGLTDNGDGTATFDPILAGEGIFTITYNYNDATNGCLGSAGELMTITACTPTIRLNNPCTCRESSPGSDGSATTQENGQFIETIQVTAPTGQNWYIAEANGFFDATSSLPPSSPTTLTTGITGATLTEAPAGVYSLTGIHVDAVGYSITLTNGTESLTISNTCAYPNPQITSDLRDGYCAGQDAISLDGNGGGASGVGQFDILNEDGSTIVVANAAEFDPAVLSNGTYQIRYTFDEDDNVVLPCQNCNPGCVQTITHVVDLVNGNGSMTCNNNAQISIDEDCVAEVLPDMVLEGGYDSYGIFDVELFYQFANIGNTVTASQIGLNLQVKVTNSCSGNSCWGNLTVEDKMKPVFDCPTAPIGVSCTADIDLIPAPTAVDNCEGTITPTLLAENIENFACGNPNGILQRIIRNWRAMDIYGNIANNCQQIIEITRPTLADVQLPQNYDDIDLPALDCNETNSDPDFTGYPTINGIALDGNTACDLTLSFNDFIIAGCGGSFEIQRTWSVFDWCAPLQSGINPLSFVQHIKYKDKTPPTITAPADMTISAIGQNCTGEITLPSAVVEDNCSNFTVTVATGAQLLNTNGGFIDNFFIGTHTIIYTAIDDCGNQSTDEMILTVVDDIAPLVFCDEFTVVSLNNSGTAELFATNINDGSFDNCSPVSFAVQIMDSGEPYAPFVTFDCEDVDSLVQVVLSVIDASGNENFCMVTVEVQNKIGPTIFCPNPVTVECTDDLNDLDITGEVNVISNCSISNIGFNDIASNLNACGVGEVVREFFATDGSGMSAICLQNITVQNSNPVTINDIEFPADYQISECITADVLQPENLPTEPINYSYPVFEDNDCSLLAVNFEDQVLTVAPPACFEILRTWTIIDWCIYDFDDPNSPGIFQETQLIQVIDTLDPVITCPADQFFPITEANCLTTVTLPNPTVDDCNPNTEITITSDFGIGAGPFTDISAGIYNATYAADDGCNNTAICTIQITVMDAKAPAPKCQNLITVVMPTSGMIEVSAADFDFGSDDNCTAIEDLQFSFSANTNDTTAVFTCDSIGLNIISLWITDESENQDLCQATLEIQDPNDACAGGLITFSGIITTEESETVGEVGVELTGNINLSMTTGSDGIFSFENILSNIDYEITPQKDIGITNGVTTIDAILVTKHVLGMDMLDSPYKIIAADINNNGMISTSDIVALRKVILLMEDNFPNNTSWRFIPADYEFSDPTNPFLDDFPESILYNNVSNSDFGADFIAIKVGDLNGTVNPNNLMSADDRSELETISLNTTNREVEQGEIFETVFSVSEFDNLESLQFALSFSEDLELVEIIENEFTNNSNFGQAKLEEGLLTFSWNNSFNQLNERQADIIHLKWRSKKNINLKEHLNISSNRIIPEAGLNYGIKNTIIEKNVNLHFKETLNSEITINNYPNPFNLQTVLSFDLPAPSPIKISIYNNEGKYVMEKTMEGNIGKNEFILNGNELDEKGLLIIYLETNWGIFKKKIIRID